MMIYHDCLDHELYSKLDFDFVHLTGYSGFVSTGSNPDWMFFRGKIFPFFYDMFL